MQGMKRNGVASQGSRNLPPIGRTAARFILGLARMCFCCGNADITVFRRVNFAPFSAAHESYAFNRNPTFSGTLTAYSAPQCPAPTKTCENPSLPEVAENRRDCRNVEAAGGNS